MSVSASSYLQQLRCVSSDKDLDIRLGTVRYDFIGNLLEVRKLSPHLWRCDFTLVLRDVGALDEPGKPRHFAGQGA